MGIPAVQLLNQYKVIFNSLLIEHGIVLLMILVHDVKVAILLRIKEKEKSV